ncbi:hypothetical protein [Aquitalea aquatica]|uniref:Anoctamin n=1 Tax=Aquitalea aquatica TaxID=3044273 RepID=A0A838Y9Q1_9NEIS|nr:hypothetical protein [Aquitalea magnusonii]MBA4707504.1 hypothetical protein [Aquitalea magnusonii]
MKYSFRYRAQEWLAERVRWAQYPRQEFIPRGQEKHQSEDWIDKLYKIVRAGFLLWFILVPIICASAVMALFLIIVLGDK